MVKEREGTLMGQSTKGNSSLVKDMAMEKCSTQRQVSGTKENGILMLGKAKALSSPKKETLILYLLMPNLYRVTSETIGLMECV